MPVGITMRSTASPAGIGTDKDMEIVELHDGTMLRIHDETECLSDYACPFHNPTEHELLAYGWGWDGSIVYRVTPDGWVIDPDDYKLNAKGFVIFRNSLLCNLCGDEIESRYRHDFVTCKCQNAMVDGGKDYLRRAGSNITDTSIVFHKKGEQG